jgi:hypothetical protein
VTVSVEASLRDELRREVYQQWVHIEDSLREAWNAERGSDEQMLALEHAFTWASEMADEYDMGDE